jgi:two-component system CheB/CheR fusion protein
MSIDVTEQVLAQQKLQENEANLQRKMEERTIELELKNKELKRSNEELDQFAYIASHDLQEPLRKIRVFGDRLSKIIEPDSPTRLLVEKILSSAQRMSGLIDNLLDYSRLTINAYGFEKVDLNSVLHNILTDFELLITQKNAEITYDNLPVIEAIPLHMNQLFYNLIGNALKFTKKGVQPVITIKSIKLPDDVKLSFSQLNPEKEYFKITVSDNGIGFNQEYGNKIFTIFQRLNDRALYGGYGIGLALCKKVADTHEGIVYAEGKPKVGAAFTIILPLRHR